MSTDSPRRRFAPFAKWTLWFLFLLAVLASVAPGFDFYLQSADHDYHLSLARQMLLGKLPFVDVFSCYGPFNAVLAAAALKITGSLVGESITCAAGYALALTLVAVIVSRLLPSPRFPSNLLPFALSLFGLLLLGRFMKWFFWLFPLLFIAFLSLSAERRPRLGGVLTGCVIGLIGLCRLDLGVSLFVAGLLFSCALAIGARRPRYMARDVAFLCIGILIPASAWALFLLRAAGTHGIVDYFLASTSSSTGLVRVWSLPFPVGMILNPLAPEYRAMECGIALVCLYALAAAFAAYRVALRRDCDVRLHVVLASSLAGLFLLPQGLYRHDANHVLQTFAPALVTVPALMIYLLSRLRTASGIRQRLAALAAVAVLAIFLPGVERSLHGRKPYDYQRLGPSSLTRFESLSRDISPTSRPVAARIARRIMELTASSDSILVVSQMIAPQVTFFARRPVSGVVTTYAEGIFDSPFWRERNLEAVRRSAPAIVVVPPDFDRPSARSDMDKAPFSEFQPELYAYLRDNYTVTVAVEDGYALMAREARPAKP